MTIEWAASGTSILAAYLLQCVMPQIVQQLMRLKDIRRRIEAGASVEAVGE